MGRRHELHAGGRARPACCPELLAETYEKLAAALRRLMDGDDRRSSTVGIFASRTSATGPAVVLLHPGLWDMRTWDPQIGALPTRLPRDALRPAGLRAVEPPGRASRTRTSRDLWRAAGRRAASSSAALVGCSMGGAVAIDAALAVPDRVWALVPAAAGLGGFEPTAEEEEWWEDAGAGIEEAVEAGELVRAQDLRLRDLGAARHRRRGRRRDPRGSRWTTSTS